MKNVFYHFYIEGAVMRFITVEEFMVIFSMSKSSATFNIKSIESRLSKGETVFKRRTLNEEKEVLFHFLVDGRPEKLLSRFVRRCTATELKSVGLT